MKVKEKQILEKIMKMTPEERTYINRLIDELNNEQKVHIAPRGKKDEEYKKALYMIDMNNGFVNFGPMANPEYNKLVPEQLELIEKFRDEDELVNFILEGHDEHATEFKKYPPHCIIGTKEADLIPEFVDEQDKPNTWTFYKNSVNGMLNISLQEKIRRLKNLKEVVYAGVCTDLCDFDFALTNARFLDEINKEAKLFVVKSCIDTFDAPGHNKNEMTEMALKMMTQAGIEVVENVEHLKVREKQLGLYLK